MGAATRPAEAPEQSRTNRPTWLIVAFVCLVAAIVYLCLSISEGLGRGDRSLPGVLEVAPEQGAQAVADPLHRAHASPPSARNRAMIAVVWVQSREARAISARPLRVSR